MWVGEDVYLGNWASALIIFSAFQLVFIRHDAFMLNMMLDIKSKVFYGAISLGLTVMLAFVLVPRYGVIGLSVALIVGRFLLTVIYPYLIRRFLLDKLGGSFGARKPLITLSIFGCCALLGAYVEIGSWVELLLYAASVMSLAILALLVTGLSQEDRHLLSHRFTMIRQSLAAR